MSRVLRSASTYLTNLALTAVTILVGFVVTPTLLRLLDVERFGAARAAQDWISSLTLIDAAMLMGLMPMLASAYAGADPDRLSRILATVFVTYLKAIAAMLLIGFALVAALPWLVPVDPSLVGDLRLGGAIGVLSFLFVPLGIFRGMIEARQRGYMLSLMIGVQSVSMSLMSLGFAWLGWGITGQFAAAFGGQAILALLLAVDAWFSSRDVLRNIRWTPDPEIAAQVRNLNVQSLISQFCSKIGLMMDNIIVAGLLEPALVAPFLLTQRLVAMIGGQLLAVGNSAWAALADLYGRNELDRFNQRMIQLSRIVVFLSVGVTGPAAIYTQSLITLWVGPSRYAGHEVVALAALNSLAMGLMSLWGWGICGTGHMSRMVVIQVPSTILNVAISLLATRALGMVGPLIGSFVIAYCLHLWIVPLVMRSLFGTNLWELAKAVALPLLCGAPFLALVAFTAHTWPPHSWIALFIHLGVAPLLYFGVCGWMVFSSAERGEFLAGIQRLRKAR